MTAKSGWEKLMESEGDKKYGAHNERNQSPILEKLLFHLPELASPSSEVVPLQVLEVASGTGQHASFLSKNLHNLLWIPTDYDPGCIKSTDLWTVDVRDKVLPCALLDVTKEFSSWPVSVCSVDVIYNCNMIHLAPIAVMKGFFAGAGHVARPNAKLFLYGPFSIDGDHVSESNAAFDKSLRERDPTWGVRDLAEVQQELQHHGFTFIAKEVMPANNFMLVFQKVGSKV